MALLSIEHLRVEYRTGTGRRVVIPDLSLALDSGESFGLVGESGCGKSTLIMAILGYLGANGRIAGGRIGFEGQDIATLSPAALRRIRGSRIAIVYQEPASALNPALTIGRQLMEVPMTHDGASTTEARARAERVLADVHLPDPPSVMRRYPHQLSGGQMQRVVIAMALLANPALLLLDEPTTGLDVTVEAAVLDLVAELRRRTGTALLYISHNLGVIAQVCDRIGVMYAGEIVEDAPAPALFARPRHPYTRGLLAAMPAMAPRGGHALQPIPGAVPIPGAAGDGCRFAPRCQHALPVPCLAGPIALVPAGPSHAVRCARWEALPDDAPPPAAPADPALAVAAPAEAAVQVRALSRAFPVGRRTLKANDRLDFAAARGSVLAIVGESGSGKSTFARILAGLDGATGGQLIVHGEEMGGRLVRKRTAAEVAAIQMVFQNPDGTLNPAHAVGRPIARALRQFGTVTGRGAVQARVRALLEMVRLSPGLRHAKPRQLSGGQKQRIAIARAFAGNPSVLVADEPVSALDVSVQAAVVNLLLRIQREQATTLVFISHDLALVRHLADTVVVMYLGRVMESGTAEAVFQPPYHPYTEALLSAVPVADPSVKTARIRLEGEIPSPLDVPPGCRFAGRCPRKVGPVCDTTEPPARDAGDGHMILCHIPLDQLRDVPPVFRRAS